MFFIKRRPKYAVNVHLSFITFRAVKAQEIERSSSDQGTPDPRGQWVEVKWSEDTED